MEPKKTDENILTFVKKTEENVSYLVNKINDVEKELILHKKLLSLIIENSNIEIKSTSPIGISFEKTENSIPVDIDMNSLFMYPQFTIVKMLGIKKKSLEYLLKYLNMDDNKKYCKRINRIDEDDRKVIKSETTICYTKEVINILKEFLETEKIEDMEDEKVIDIIQEYRKEPEGNHELKESWDSLLEEIPNETIEKIFAENSIDNDEDD